MIDICSGSQLAVATETISVQIKIAANVFTDTRVRSRALARGHAAIEMFSARCIAVPQVANLRYYSSPGLLDFLNGMISFMLSSPGTNSICTPPLVSFPSFRDCGRFCQRMYPGGPAFAR